MARWLSYCVIATLVYGAWAQGGVYPPLQWPLTSLSALSLGGLFFLSHKEARILILRDPLFYIGLAFLLLLVAQSVNSGYAVMWDGIADSGMSVLPAKWLPWSVEPKAAAQLFNWFFPAWVAILAVRHALGRADIRFILQVLVWNAAALAVVGLVQTAFGAEKMLGLWEIPGGSFYATFGYENHGGAFFYLHAAIAAGLGHQAIKRHEPLARVITWIVCFTLLLAAAFGSLSRAAGLAGLIIVVGAFGGVVKGAWKRSKGNQIINLIGVGAVVILAGLVMYFSAGGGELAAEIEDTVWGERMEQAVEGRTMQLPSGWEIAQDWPVFGCGGWGYRWVALLYIPVDEWDLWSGPGKANVHCDPLQFLCEFGLVGSLLLAACVLWLVKDYARAWREKGGAAVLSKWAALGLLLIWAHAFVDLPFRCPVILITWCLVLAALPKLAEKPRHGYMLGDFDE